jgi:hypothetical protein
MTATNKRLPYLRVVVIRINVHPAGENPTNTICTLLTPVHVRPAYASYGRSPYMATFHESSTDLSRPTAHEKKGSWHNPQRVGWPIHGSVPSFSPEPANEVVGAKPSIYQRLATRLTAPISPACDWYVQYSLTGTNPSVLNRHRRGYHIENLTIATTLFPLFPSEGFTNPPNGPARS